MWRLEMCGYGGVYGADWFSGCWDGSHGEELGHHRETVSSEYNKG